MTMQHTPAPWSVDIDHSSNAPEFIRTYVDGEMYDLASVLCDETGNATANARLIAAAPDLLELARQIVLAAEQNEGSIPADIVSGAVAAIARATGGAA